jgi:rubrerythrin
MGIEEALSKLKLVDIKAEFKPEGEQVGIVNVKNVEANQTVNYHFHLSDPDTARALGEGILGKLPEVEARAKESAKRKLEPIESVIDVLPTSSQTEVASAAVGIAVAEEVWTGMFTVPVPKMQGTSRTVIMCKGCGMSVDIEHNYCPKCGTKLR